MIQNFSDDSATQQSIPEQPVKMNKDYLAILEKSRDKVFIFARNGHINHATSAAIELFGFSLEEFQKLNLLKIIHPEDLPLAEECVRQVIADPGKPIEYRFRVLDHKSHFRWIEGTFSNLLDDPHFGYIISQFRDIDEKIKDEKEQALLIQDLTRRNHDLNQFAYIVSHNLRTPLSNLSGLLTILEVDHIDEYNKSIIDLFKTSTERLTETITDLTHILNRKNDQRVKLAQINVQRTMEKVTSAFAESILSLPIKLNLNFTHKHILFNKSYLESILTNLTSNAIKYRDPSRQLEITVSLNTDDQDRKVLTFADNGMGIDLDSNKDELFGLNKRFHQHINGNGVGLFITKSQITSLSGKIEVSSKVNEGTEFTITFCNDHHNQELLADS